MDLSQRMGQDWQALAGHVRSREIAPVAQYLDHALSSATSNYRIVQRSMEEFCFSQVFLVLCFELN